MAKDYTVIWYVDGSGIIRSVQPNSNVSGRLSFAMPKADVEVYCAKDMTLDLDNADYTLLQDGFRTESEGLGEVRCSIIWAILQFIRAL